MGSVGAAIHAPVRLTMPRLAPVHWRRLEKVFLAAGFVFVRQEGSHRSYYRAGTARPVVIPT